MRNQTAALCRMTAFALLIATGLIGRPALAQTPGTWSVQNVAVAPNGVTYVLWTNTYTFPDNGTGQAAVVWTFDASDQLQSTGALFGPYEDYFADDLVTAPDSSARLEWVDMVYSGTTYEGDAFVVWSLDQSGYQTEGGYQYGPYGPSTDGNSPYTASDGISVGSDGTTRVPLVSPGPGSGDQVVVFTLDSTGAVTSYGTVYGPYSSWYYYGLTPGPNGVSDLLWTEQFDPYEDNNAFSLWTLDDNGNALNYGPIYGPYQQDSAYWTLQSFDVDQSDGSIRVLWTLPVTDSPSAEGSTASVWSLDPDGVVTSYGPAFGPITDWNAYGIAANSDGSTSLGWDTVSYNYPQPDSVLWLLDPTGNVNTYGPESGPYTNWIIEYVGANHTDGSIRYLWEYDNMSDGSDPENNSVALWTLDSAGEPTVYGPEYTP